MITLLDVAIQAPEDMTPDEVTLVETMLNRIKDEGFKRK